MRWEAAASEGICALEVQLDAFVHEALSIAPLVHAATEMGVLTGYSGGGTGKTDAVHIGRESAV
jgi:hypothetical protein